MVTDGSVMETADELLNMRTTIIVIFFTKKPRFIFSSAVVAEF